MKFKIKRLIEIEQVVDIPVNDIKDDTQLKGRIAIKQENLLNTALNALRSSNPYSIEAKGVSDSHLKTELVEI